MEHVRTTAGAKYFKEPVGSPITGKGRNNVETPSQFVHPTTGKLMSASEVGDTFEELFRKKGAHLLEDRLHSPYSPVAHAKVKGALSSRNTPLDFKLDGTHGGELKTMNANAKRKKTAITAESLARKYTAVRKAGIQPVLAVQVVDMDKKNVSVYMHPNFGSKSVTSMEPLGSYTFSQKEFEDAQAATGHGPNPTGGPRAPGGRPRNRTH